MKKEELNKTAKSIFDKNSKENTLHCIDNGNFWFDRDKVSAIMYSKKLNSELITIKREDLVEVEKTEPKKVVKKTTRNKKNNK